jgi:hypothetical protein
MPMTERSAVKPNRNMVAFFMIAAWMDVSANAIYAQQAAAEPVGTDRIQVFDYKLEPRENFTTAAFASGRKHPTSPSEASSSWFPERTGTDART